MAVVSSYYHFHRTTVLYFKQDNLICCQKFRIILSSTIPVICQTTLFVVENFVLYYLLLSLSYARQPYLLSEISYILSSTIPFIRQTTLFVWRKFRISYLLLSSFIINHQTILPSLSQGKMTDPTLRREGELTSTLTETGENNREPELHTTVRPFP